MATKILMVCLGNICRSPLAEGILRSKISRKDILIDSAGTGHWHVGEGPDKRSVAVAKKHGVDISAQRARQFSETDFDHFDHIFVMDQENMRNVLQKAKNETQKKKVKLLLNELFINENVDVPDPYHGGKREFEHVFQLLDEACEVLAKKFI